MKPLMTGDLTCRPILQAKSVTRDTNGAEVVTWTDIATVWANIADLGGWEFFAARQEFGQVNTRIRIRYRRDVVPFMRWKWQNAHYDIIAVQDPDGHRTELIVMCRKLVGQEVA